MSEHDVIIFKSIMKYCIQIDETIERLGLTEQTFYYDHIGKNVISMCLMTIGEYANDLTEDARHKYSGWI